MGNHSATKGRSSWALVCVDTSVCMTLVLLNEGLGGGGKREATGKNGTFASLRLLVILSKIKLSCVFVNRMHCTRKFCKSWR